VVIDGHQETCRARKRLEMAQKRHPAPAVEANSTSTDEASCLICLESPKTHAFVPCGHVVGCLTCVISLSQCPVCRAPREALLHVELKGNSCVCKHCKQAIAPTFFDAHREVCALRQRQQKEVKDERSPLLRKAESSECPQCRLVKADTALVPCGHAFCLPCAKTIQCCPFCLQDKTGVLSMFL